MRETERFLAQLLRNAPPSAYLTMTAIHPDHKHRTPSRHIPIHEQADTQRKDLPIYFAPMNWVGVVMLLLVFGGAI
jgi:hypothetical protein